MGQTRNFNARPVIVDLASQVRQIVEALKRLSFVTKFPRQAPSKVKIYFPCQVRDSHALGKDAREKLASACGAARFRVNRC